MSETWPSKQSYSAFDIAKLCGVDQDTVIEWMKAGKLRYYQIPGGHWRVPHPSLDDFLKTHQKTSPKDWSKSDTYRVLVVEDDPDLLEIIGDHLRDELKVEVRTVDHGFSAGLQIASWHPDLILLDFVMPGMNGFEVCERLRQNPDTKDIPVLAITALADKDNRERVMQSGVSDFLGKPFRSEDLIKKVKSLLGLSGGPT